MGIFSFISSIFSPAVDLIDELHVSDEEKQKLQNELATIQQKMQEKSVDLMKAEVKSDSWLTSSWRPLCSLSLFILILLDAFNVIKAPEQVYRLSEFFLSAYAGGRSLEKVANVFKR